MKRSGTRRYAAGVAHTQHVDDVAILDVMGYDPDTVAKISMVIPDADLAAIDEVASPNRTAFMLEAALFAVARVRRERLDAEVARCLAETADEDALLADTFSGTAADGL